ncbi:MAG: endo-1,3-alpha-glucanase family glycosylhydrolase, partial [Chloroflexota bacterium]
MKPKICFHVLRLFCIFLILTTHTTQLNAASSEEPLVFAFYYAWFDENTWTSGTLSDLPTQPYASRDRSVMVRHMQQAQQAGIDALMVAWYGPYQNSTETHLIAILDEAAKLNFKIGILFETDSPFMRGTGAITGGLQHALSRHMQHPAYMRIDGRPLLFFWRPHMYTVATWSQIRSQTDPAYSSIWISEGIDVSYLSVFDGHHLYSNTWNPPSDLTYTNQKFAQRVSNARQQYGGYKYWVSTVMPGYNDVLIRPNDGFAHSRANGDYYAQSWQAAILSKPDWIVITSFNEWPEGTYIEPSVKYGSQYLTLTRTWSEAFKTSRGYTIQAAQVNLQSIPPTPNAISNSASQPVSQSASQPASPTPPHPHTPTPPQPPAGPTAYVNVTLLNLRQQPNQESQVLAQIPNQVAMPITGRNPVWPNWWQVQYNSVVGWVYASMVQTSGALQNVPLVDASSQQQNRG